MSVSGHSSKVPRYLWAAGCLLFLALSFALWMCLQSTTARVAYYVVFLIPNFLAGQYLIDRILKRSSFMSTEAAGFWVSRVLLGALLVCLVFALGYAAWAVLAAS